MKKIIICSVLPGVCVLAYFWFEPIFTYNFGWKSLQADYSRRNEIIYDTSYANSIERAHAYLKDSIGLQTPALSVALGIDGKLVWASASGLAHVERNIDATPASAFRIGSTSKAVTSVGLGILLENNRIALNDTVSNEIIDKEITISQLASHTSGIRNYALCVCFPVWEYFNNDSYSSVTEAVAVFRNDPLLFESGTGFSYSSYNFTALSAAMEQAAGEDFTRFMEKHVFRSSGMTNTGFDYQDVTLARAEFYDVEPNHYKRTFKVDNSNKWAGGGMISTPSDLVQLGNSLLMEAILKKVTFETLTTPVRIANGEVNEQNYALGWRVDEFELSDKKVTVIHHGGTATGSTALWIIIPEYNLTAAIMINRSVEGFPLFDILLPIVEFFINPESASGR